MKMEIIMERKHILLIFSSLLLVIFVLGCSSTSVVNPIGDTADNVTDIIMNPAKYENQIITITITPIPANTFLRYTYRTTFEGSDYYIETEDKEGKPIRLGVNYSQFYCETCEIQGLVSTIEWCTCNIVGSTAQREITDCNATRRFCVDDPKISYYIDVIDVTKIN